jgi:hypothetical protein
MRRCSRVPDEVPGTYHVCDGQALISVIDIDGSEYIAIDIDGAHHGRPSVTKRRGCRAARTLVMSDTISLGGIKALGESLDRPLGDLIALARANDPFYIYGNREE